MVLDSATADDPFADPGDAYGSSGQYPPPPPVPTFLGFQTGTFSDAGRQRFINVQLNLAKREFGFQPTPLEREGISYYHALFYAAEAKGALVGTLGGGAVGFLMTRRQRNVGFLYRGLGNWLRIAPKWQLLMSRLTNFAFVTALGRLWGITSYGVSAFNTVNKTQKEDPNMQRYLTARRQWLEIRQRNARAGIPPKRVIEGPADIRKMAERYEVDDDNAAPADQPQSRDDDPQSLGGVGFYDDEANKGTEDAVAARRASMEARLKARASTIDTGRTQQSSGETGQDEDPFFGGEDSAAAASGSSKTPAAPSQTRGGSAWDALRRRGSGAENSSGGSSSPGWSRGSSQPKEDSFSFSSDAERDRARAEAQREFNERVERERQGEGQDGFVSEGGRRR